MKVIVKTQSAERHGIDVSDLTPDERRACEVNFAQHLVEKVQFVQAHSLAVALTKMEARFLEQVLFAYLEDRVTE